MTVLVLAHRKIKDFFPRAVFSQLEVNWDVLNSKGKLFTVSLITGIIILAGVYLFSLYFIFQTSFVMRDYETRLDKLEKEARLRELEANSLETTLAKESEALAQMEKISLIRYLRSRASEVSYK